MRSDQAKRKMAWSVFYPETCKDQIETPPRRRNIDALGGALFEQTDGLIRELRALLGVEDLKHRSDLVERRREDGRGELVRADRRRGVEQIGIYRPTIAMYASDRGLCRSPHMSLCERA